MMNSLCCKQICSRLSEARKCPTWLVRSPSLPAMMLRSSLGQTLYVNGGITRTT